MNKETFNTWAAEAQEHLEQLEQAKKEGKPEAIIEKMVEGRINKFYQESCLMEQTYIKDPDKKVNDLLTETVSTLGENITVKRFVRFSIGESSN